ncbi:tRNA (N6-isopentenyl adenosine(37)-C2)-methylthiotransferase MiaB [Candidatus Solincola sp.]|nr:tRNA (N6-isopentenyl adenosine(37)-C2)-methylthiotransferase MiaB [Actinomycetota bacterium]MDI7251288.1 tRNA (N6-isopentenyl adenosine(37)-C2)-methylthiotransferase MiaB [Actinomycetota bacterium]
MEEEKSFALLTFGCQMNLHDAERIAGILHAAGWRETEPGQAGAVILLTCCVRESAEERLYGRLSSLRPLKEERGTLIAVGGCLAQKDGRRLLERASHVDLVFGTHQFPRIAELLEEAAERRVCALGMNGLRLAGLPARRKENFRAWVTITHGCDNFCSYCVVPYVRGREMSRPPEEILEEVGRLVEEGAREINLLGQNVNSYRLREEGRSRFAELLRLLGREFPGVWIRFTTSHPRDFDRRIMEAIAETENVCEHVHLPVQAGSDRILQAMNRGYRAADYLRKVEELRDLVDGVVLTTDLMVGFPGETEEDFRQTLELVERCRFDAAFTFIYNPRPGTAASRLGDDVPREVKLERLERLADLTRRLTAESLRGRVGRVEHVLVEGPSRKDEGMWKARTRGNQLVHFPRGRENLEGKLARVRITHSGSWSLYGELVEIGGFTG